MNKLKPKYWLAGHMHYYYRNKISHNKIESTEFIALDKIIDKNRQFLDIITLEVNDKISNEDDRNLDGITFDNYWLYLIDLLQVSPEKQLALQGKFSKS